MMPRRKITPRIAAAAIAALLLFSRISIAGEPKVEKDILFDVQNGIELRGDMYVPDGKGPFPGILFIHGGGFVGGTKNWTSLVPLIRYFVDRGYAVFSSDYRLLKDNGIFPNNIKDSKCALAWLKTNAAKYNVDAGRIGVMGESAGAYLAGMLATTAVNPDMNSDCPIAKGVDMSVQAGVLFYPPTDFVSFEGGFSQVLRIELMRMASLKNKKQVLEFEKKYSPLTYVNSAVPLFISNSDPDRTVPPQQSHIMVEKLKKAGKTVEYLEVTGEGMDHGFVLSQPDCSQSVEAKEKAAAFLDKYVKNTGGK